MGNLEDALKCQLEGLKVCKKRWGDEHPQTGSVVLSFRIFASSTARPDVLLSPSPIPNVRLSTFPGTAFNNLGYIYKLRKE